MPTERNVETGEGPEIVVGLFQDQTQAERAIRDLKESGFPETDIGVLMQDRKKEAELAEGTGTKAGEGAAAGAVSGGILGGVFGLLAGTGALVIPGVGPIIAGGVWASTLAGAGVGATAGGLLGALVGMGIPQDEARFYERGIREGGILVTVDSHSRVAEAREILIAAGAGFGRGSETDLEETELPSGTEAWRGNERRFYQDVGYNGPERRLARL